MYPAVGEIRVAVGIHSPCPHTLMLCRDSCPRKCRIGGGNKGKRTPWTKPAVYINSALQAEAFKGEANVSAQATISQGSSLAARTANFPCIFEPAGWRGLPTLSAGGCRRGCRLERDFGCRAGAVKPGFGVRGGQQRSTLLVARPKTRLLPGCLRLARAARHAGAGPAAPR